MNSLIINKTVNQQNKQHLINSLKISITELAAYKHIAETYRFLKL